MREFVSMRHTDNNIYGMGTGICPHPYPSPLAIIPSLS